MSISSPEAPAGEVPTAERPDILAYAELADGLIQLQFSYEGKMYDTALPGMSQTESVDWLTEFGTKTPRCACCDRIMFPGQPLAAGHIVPNDSGLSHLSADCNHAPDDYAGIFNIDGQVISPWPHPDL